MIHKSYLDINNKLTQSITGDAGLTDYIKTP